MPIPIPNQNRAPLAGPFREEMVWQQLKTVRDPEIPVNIVDLGLIYAAEVSTAENGSKRIHVRMTLTAPGCSMSDVIKAEVEHKLAALPEVSEVRVEVVFDPPWDKSKMSEAAKLHLGFDMDYGKPAPAARGPFKIVH
ncbi:MAG: iron-sulfur cluster assembly protein [Terracidiphilus sp.]